MRNILLLITAIFSFSIVAAQEYMSPESVIWDEQRQIFYVSNVGNYQDPDGFILTLDLESKKDYLINTGLDDPKGMVIIGDNLYVADLTRIVEINLESKTITNTYKIPGAIFLNDIEAGNNNLLYTSDMQGHKIFKLDLNTKIASPLDLKSTVTAPNGLLFEKASNRLYAVGFTEPSILYTINLTDNSVSNYTLPFSYGDGISKNADEQLIISAWTNTVNPFFTGEIYQMDKLTGNFEMIASAFSGPADIFYFSLTDELIIPEMMMDEVYFLTLYQSLTKPVLIKPINESAENIPINLDFEWLADKNISKYVFNLSKNADFLNDVVSVNMWTQNSFSFESLDFDATYYWKVTGYTVDDSVESEVWSFKTTQNTIEEVTLISPEENEEITGKDVNFVWSKGLAPYYELQIDVSKMFNTPELKIISGIAEPLFNPAETYKDGVYQWRVRNYNDVNSSPYSKIGSFVFKNGGLVEDEIFSKDIIVYPNPAVNKINITILDNLTVNNMNIYSNVGELVYDNKTVTNEINIDLSDFAIGTYFIEFNINNQRYIKKIIKK